MSYLNQGIGTTVLLLLPTLLLILLFLHFKKKRGAAGLENGRFGRRGKKDHAWQIIKEYHRQMNRVGTAIEDSFVFERPEANELRDALEKGQVFLEKARAKSKGVKYRKTKDPARIAALEEHFRRLEQETGKHHREPTEIKGPRKRKRYVILYRTKKREELSDWQALEVELIRKSGSRGEPKDSVVVNGELKVEEEMAWIAPLLDERITERARKIKAEERRKTRGDLLARVIRRRV